MSDRPVVSFLWSRWVVAKNKKLRCVENLSPLSTRRCCRSVRMSPSDIFADSICVGRPDLTYCSHYKEPTVMGAVHWRCCLNSVANLTHFWLRKPEVEWCNGSFSDHTPKDWTKGYGEPSNCTAMTTITTDRFIGISERCSLNWPSEFPFSDTWMYCN